MTKPVSIDAPPIAPRRIALLQGPPGRFWSELGDAFAAALAHDGPALLHLKLDERDISPFAAEQAV